MKNISKIAFFMVCLLTASSAAASGIYVKMGKAKKYTLGGRPNVVVIGNPNVADVIIEDNRVMFVIGVSVGETSLHILGPNGGTILRRTIHVSAPSSRHVTVMRGTGVTEMTCQAGRCYRRPNYTARGEATGGGGNNRLNGRAGQDGTTDRSGDLN